MSQPRRAKRSDNNQTNIVKALRQIPGVSVAVNHDDILIGYKGRTYWFEVKNPNTISKKTGKVLHSKIKDSQKELLKTWCGHYAIVTSVTEILEEIGMIQRITKEKQC